MRKLKRIKQCSTTLNRSRENPVIVMWHLALLFFSFSPLQGSFGSGNRR